MLEIIKARGKSAYELGQDADVDRSIITRFVAGETLPSLANIDRLGAALGLRLVETGSGRATRRHRRESTGNGA